MQPELRTHEIYKDEDILIELDENLKFIYVEWQRHVDRQKFRSLFATAATIALESKCLYWLSDARQIHFVDFADQNWLLREMTPILLKSSLLKFARISSKESLAMQDVHRVYSELKNLTVTRPVTEIEIFLNKEDALNWLFEGF